MRTRKRDYAANPRSPRKPRKPRLKRNKQVLQEINLGSTSSPSTTHLTENQPTLSSTNTNTLTPNVSLADLPPLPDSSSEYSLPPLPDSPSSGSELAVSFSKLTLRYIDSTYTLNRKITDYPSLSNKPFTSTPKLFYHNPIDSTKPYSTMSKSSTPFDNVELTAQDITEAKENLSNEIKFDHLTSNGSNFTEWKKNTARAIKALIGIKHYWDDRLPILNYLERKRDGLAASVINNTIHVTLKNVTDDADSAYDAMEALQNHFRKGGRTAQFSLFNRLVNLRLDLNETEMISHMSKVDAIVSEMESTGFAWNADSIKGLFYQIVMPADMTKEINKDLDSRYDKTSPNYKLKDIKSAIQIHLTREKTASETITINNLSTPMEFMSINPRLRPFGPTPTSTPTRPYTQNQRSTPFRAAVKINPMRWQRGPAAWTSSDTERKDSAINPIAMPVSAVGGVKAGLLQCFFCGAFGHTYTAGGCRDYNGNSDRLGAHWKDWRKLSNGQYYSLNALYPQKYNLPINQRSASTKPSASAVEVENKSANDQPAASIMSLDWSSDGFGLVDQYSEIPTEYLFDGGATDAVSNNKSLLSNYQPLPSPIPMRTAANDSHTVIVGKGDIEVAASDGEPTKIKDVYYCPKATTTIISPGALIANGAKISMTDGNDYRITLPNGKVLHACHKNRRWFIKSKVCIPTPCSPSVTSSRHVCAIKSSVELSKLWHARFGHVSMKRIQKLFKLHSEYGLPELSQSHVTCEDCLRCKGTRRRVLSTTNREPRVMEILVTDVAGSFTPCFSGEQLMVTFRDLASTYSKICIIKHKSEVFQRLVMTIKKWEHTTNLKIKIVRSDRGGEYVGTNLDRWLKEAGIVHKYSNPYEPEQNGTAERLNRTLGEMARTLLASSKLPQRFWSFAYLTAAYIHNRLPNSVTDAKTPYELFYGRKPQLDILRSFGSVAFVHIHQGQRSPGKLEDRARKCVMIGYVDGGKGWMFYDESSKTVFPSAIATFPYELETSQLKSSPSNEMTSSGSLNSILNAKTHDKGNLAHIINAMKLGDFTDEIRLDKQDVAASHALTGEDYLKILKPPRSYAEAMRSEYSKQWQEACDAEMKMMNTMSVWKVVDKPDGLTPIDLKWVFAYKKMDDEGNPVRFKARLVAKGFRQREGIDYTEMFAPTATFAGLRIMLTIAAHQNWPTHSFDISSAYLHSDIDSRVYFSIPTGYMCEARKKNKVLEALKALYGTKQGARCWWKHIDTILVSLGFKSSQYDQSLYFYRRDNDTCIIWLHSDDGGVTASSERLLEEIHKALKQRLLIKWEKGLDQIVGVTVTRHDDGSFTLSQPGLTKKTLQSFLPDERQVKTPLNCQKIPTSPAEDEEKIDSKKYLSAIGSLNYLSVATRPDITYSVNYLARFSSDPRRQHWTAVEHLMRYLNTTGVRQLSIKPIKSKVNTPMHTYIDTNWGGEGARSSHGYITYFLDCPISWTSKRQTCVASSTCHAEYMAMGSACRDAMWLRNLIEDMTGEGNIVNMHCNNTSAIHVASNNSSNKRTRHTDREFYYINEQIYWGRVFLHWIDTKSQQADILTKALGPNLHIQGVGKLKMI